MTQKNTPDRVFLTPSGGLPTGNWPKNKLVAFINSTPTREAADELLGALEVLLAITDDNKTSLEDLIAMSEAAEQKARAAIAKAKGEAG